MSTIKNNFLDLIKHTSKLGFIEMVKLIGDGTETKLEAIDNDKVVVIYGKLNDPIDGLEGTVGLSRLGILDGFLHFPPYESDNASVEISTQLRGTESTPSGVSFDSNDGHQANYRFMAEMQANEQIKVPPFKGATWNVEIEPTKQNLRDLSYISGVMGSYESTFMVKTIGDNLEFHVGTGSSDRSKLTIAKGITGSMSHSWSWPLTHVLSILKLLDSAKKCTMHFSNQGALKIEITSAFGTYQYILPARNV